MNNPASRGRPDGGLRRDLGGRATGLTRGERRAGTRARVAADILAISPAGERASFSACRLGGTLAGCLRGGSPRRRSTTWVPGAEWSPDGRISRHPARRRSLPPGFPIGKVSTSQEISAARDSPPRGLIAFRTIPARSRSSGARVGRFELSRQAGPLSGAARRAGRRTERKSGSPPRPSRGSPRPFARSTSTERCGSSRRCPGSWSSTTFPGTAARFSPITRSSTRCGASPPARRKSAT